MFFIEKLNIKKTLEEIKEEESGFELADQEAPKQFQLYDRLAMDIADIVAPESASNQVEYFKVGEDYTRTLYIHTFPHQVDDNWLREILRFPHALDVAIYIQPLDIKVFLQKMRHQAARDEAAVQKEMEDGYIHDARREARLRDTLQFISSVEEDITKPFQVMVALTLRSRSVKDLDRTTADLERKLTILTTRKTHHKHREGFETTLPLMQNELADMKTVRSIHTQGLMSMFPFTSADLSHDEGVMVGLNQITRSPIILNRFMQPEIDSPNTAIIGTTGSGKSFFAKLEMLRWAYLGKPIVILDPSSEYARVCKSVGGANISINLDSADVINPLDFSNAVRPGHNALNEKIGFLIELVKMMISAEDGGVQIDAYSKSLFGNALKIVYEGYGYSTDDISTQQAASAEHMPVMSEVVHTLSEIARTVRDPEVQKRIGPINASLATYVEGFMAPLFNQKTTVDLRSHFINFDYSGLPRQYLALSMYIVLEFLRTSYFTAQQQESNINRIIYVDEAQILMENQGTASFLDYTARTCRKYGIGITVMTQNVGVFVQGEDLQVKSGQGILSNCSIKVLLKQQSTEGDIIQQQFKLTQNEMGQLMGAGTGEGLLFVDRDSVWFSSQNMASPEEYEILTTVSTERAAILQKDQNQQINPGNERQISTGTPDENHQLNAPEDPFE